MSLSRYDHEQVKNLIDGYMVPSIEKRETRQEEFERAKRDLRAALLKRIEQVESFSFEDLSKKVS